MRSNQNDVRLKLTFKLATCFEGLGKFNVDLKFVELESSQITFSSARQWHDA